MFHFHTHHLLMLLLFRNHLQTTNYYDKVEKEVIECQNNCKFKIYEKKRRFIFIFSFLYFHLLLYLSTFTYLPLYKNNIALKDFEFAVFPLMLFLLATA